MKNLPLTGKRNREERQKEFVELAMPLMDRLYSTALHLAKDPVEAEDLLQDTYLKAWRFFDNYVPGTNFRGWIFRILTTTYINHYNRQKRQPQRSDFEVVQATTAASEKPEGKAGVAAPQLQKTPAELFDDDISAALEQLPENYLLVVLLSDIHELSYKEIAGAVDCPIGTVMSRLSRGRAMLAESLKSYAVSNGYISAP